jgi:hypothetical protein
MLDALLGVAMIYAGTGAMEDAQELVLHTLELTGVFHVHGWNASGSQVERLNQWPALGWCRAWSAHVACTRTYAENFPI